MPPGRPLELSRETVERTKDLLRRTLYLETVADALGTARQVFRRWLRAGEREHRRRQRGKDPDPKFDLHCELSSAVKKVLAETSGDMLSRIVAAGQTQWQALAWVLERRFPERWGQNRAEIREMKRRLDELEKAHGNPPPPPPKGKPTRRRPASRKSVE